METVDKWRRFRNRDKNSGEGQRTMEDNLMRTLTDTWEDDKEAVEMWDNGYGRQVQRRRKCSTRMAENIWNSIDRSDKYMGI